MSKFITAKELSSEVELSEKSIRRASVQKRLGIDGARDSVCSKPIRFRKEETRRALAKRGYKPGF